MERVKQALEKAQKKRKNSVVANNVTAVNVETKQQPDSGIVEIEYTQTQKIKVDQKVLIKNRVVAGIKDHPIADYFKILRAKTLQRMKANHWNVLAMTSPTSGAGKSLTAVNLAVSVALDSNYSVLLVDLDFRRPSLHQYFDIMPDKGLIDYLSGEASISDLLIHPGMEGLVLLPAGKAIRHSSELLSTTKMQGLAHEIKNRYPDRIVIIDLPPLLVTDDAIVFLPQVDACILVVGEGETTGQEITDSLALIEEKKYLGSVLNKTAEVDTSSYYH